jgi:hypothetical protein
MNYRHRYLPFIFAAACLATLAVFTTQAGDMQPVIRNHTIGYVITTRDWAVYMTPNKAECPHGVNALGTREQFKALFPNDGTKRTYLDTAMSFEAEIWFPSGKDIGFPFYLAEGPISYGMNLDGKIKPTDFTSPDGEKGIDNQLYRVIGCSAMFRESDMTKYMRDYNFARSVIEISNVDNLTNDDDVTVTTYRGLDSLMMDASGSNFLPRGTERVDERFGKELIQHFHGRIKNGILETDPADVSFAMTYGLSDVSTFTIKGMRWRLKLTPDGAEGVMAGYAAVDDFYFHYNKVLPTHYQTYYQLSSRSLYRALQQQADGYPDARTGRNTAISSALNVKMVQVFIQHQAEDMASNGTAPAVAKITGAGK